MHVGERLRSWRKYLEISLAELARAASVGSPTLSKIERRLQGVREEQVRAMARHMGLTMSEFYGPIPSPIPDDTEPKAANG